jgi:hypothetical protein
MPLKRTKKTHIKGLSSMSCVGRDAKNDNPYLSGTTDGLRGVVGRVAIHQEHDRVL